MSEVTPIKLCMNCKHYVVSANTTDEDNFDKCYHPNLVIIDPVKGKVKPVYCEAARRVNQTCGLSGNYYTSKESY